MDGASGEPDGLAGMMQAEIPAMDPSVTPIRLVPPDFLDRLQPPANSPEADRNAVPLSEEAETAGQTFPHPNRDKSDLGDNADMGGRATPAKSGAPTIAPLPVDHCGAQVCRDLPVTPEPRAKGSLQTAPDPSAGATMSLPSRVTGATNMQMASETQKVAADFVDPAAPQESGPGVRGVAAPPLGTQSATVPAPHAGLRLSLETAVAPPVVSPARGSVPEEQSSATAVSTGAASGDAPAPAQPAATVLPPGMVSAAWPASGQAAVTVRNAAAGAEEYPPLQGAQAQPVTGTPGPMVAWHAAEAERPVLALSRPSRAETIWLSAAMAISEPPDADIEATTRLVLEPVAGREGRAGQRQGNEALPGPETVHASRPVAHPGADTPLPAAADQFGDNALPTELVPPGARPGAATPPLPAQPGQMPPAPMPQLSAAIVHTLTQTPDGATEINLSPEELGRVRLTLQADASNPDRMVVMLSFDRPETLDLFRRHAAQLAEALRAAGYSETTLGFGQHSAEQPPFGQSQRGAAAEPGQPPDPAAPVAQEALQWAGPRRLNLASAASLDLRL